MDGEARRLIQNALGDAAACVGSREPGPKGLHHSPGKLQRRNCSLVIHIQPF